MKVGDLIRRKWDVAERGELPNCYRAGVVVEFKAGEVYSGATKKDFLWVVVRWVDGHGVGNSMYHPENLEVVSESR